MGQKISILCSCIYNLCCCKKSPRLSSQSNETEEDSVTLLQSLRRRITPVGLWAVSNHDKDLILIWLDEQNDIDLENTAQMKNLLEKINDHTLLFSNKDKFFDYLETITDQTIFLILSGQFSTHLLPLINNNQQIHAIYIFCIQDDRYQNLIDHHPKLRGVFNNHRYLNAEIQKDIRTHIKQSMKFNSFNKKEQKSVIDLSLESAEFLWCYVLKDVLMNIDKTDDAKQVLIDYCRSEYETNHVMLEQIDDFEENYKPEDAIKWYTKDSFVYRLVNKSIRTENINALLKLKFFIVDLSTRLKLKWEKDYSQNHRELIRVYHGARLTDNETHKLKSGSLISPNGYLSTSLSFETACIYAHNIIFEIEIDPLMENLIFANIAEYSQFPEEEEVLFDLGCTFRIISVDYDESNQRSIVVMIGVNEAEKLANKFIKTIKETKKTKGYFDGLISDFVHNLGYKTSLNVYEHCLTIPIHDIMKIRNNCLRFFNLYEKYCDASNVAIFFGCVGWFFTQRAEYDLAIEYCTRALSLVEKTLPQDNIDIEVAMIHNTIGWSYYEKGGYDLALDWCQRAEKILEKCPHVEYSKYAKILRSEENLEKCSSRNDAEYAEILANLGCIYCKKMNFDMATFYCRKSMNILETSDNEMVFSDHHRTTASENDLDNHHETIASNYEIFADIDFKDGNYILALEWYKKALEIFEKVTPRIPICLQRSPYIFGRNKQRLQNSIRTTEEQILARTGNDSC